MRRPAARDRVRPSGAHGGADVPSRERLSAHLSLDSALLGAYMVCSAIVLVLLPLQGGVAWAEAGPALGLQLAVGALLAGGQRPRWLQPRFAGIAGVVAYLASVALLRDGAGPTAGYGPLVLLPVLWASLRGGRAELAVAVVGVAAVYLLPTLLIGAPQYPAGGWRGGLLFTVIATVIGFVVSRLVGHVRALVERLDGLARSDELTGLPNRRAWQDLLAHELSVARRAGHSLTVALLDLDGFKRYNDALGHLAGDELLREVTAAWRIALRETDALARWGGDEFGLLLPLCDIVQSTTLIERMRAARPDVSFSVGLAEWDGESSPDEILALADLALYDAKRTRPVAASVPASPAVPAPDPAVL
jgi:diguanylate cyclase (GGDEF)-like protein